ncbi:MAG TPA: methyl-accepting chemotaxis protein, partial [Reyranella sp.]|nr:methyl-accepting chemotaxis protein [Reyranella sp.]
MKRKVGLFLLAVMVAVSLGATIVASLAMYRLVSEQQDVEIAKIEASLADRFTVFEDMLRSEHERITANMAKVLPEIVAELKSLGRQPGDLSVAELDALAKKYGIQHIYFIDRSYRVFQTNLAYDMNLVFPAGPFTRFLDSVFGADKVMNDGIDLSEVTGTLRTYSYFGPKDRDYIVEVSTDVRTSVAEGNFGWMSKFFFEDFFTDPVRSHPYLKNVDIYLINAAGTWSLIHPGKKLDPALAERIARVQREEVDDGRYVTIYSSAPTAAATDSSYPVTSKLVVREITYDTGLAREAVLQVFVGSMIVLALLLPQVFWIASRLLQKQLLDPLFNLRGEAGAIAEGDLTQAIANTDRRDEIGQLAKSFASMRDAVRKTILDLKETNI